MKSHAAGFRYIMILSILATFLLLTSCQINGKTASTNEPPDNTPVPTISAPSATPADTSVPKSIRLAYYTGDDASWESLQMFHSNINALSLDVFTVQSDGTIKGKDTHAAATYAHDRGIMTFACISNWNSDPAIDTFDPQLAESAMLTNKDRFIAESIQLVKDGQYDGINIDLEGIAYTEDITAVREQFSATMTELAEILHENGYLLVISVPVKSVDSPDNTWAYPYDFDVLGQSADYLQLMTYDEHGEWSAPGPIAGLDWVDESVQYAVTWVDPGKLLLGLPAYAKEWSSPLDTNLEGTETVNTFTWKESAKVLEAANTEVQWDSAAASPYIYYESDEYSHEFWFEDQESIRMKTALIGSYNLAGFAMWSLGQEDAQFWQATKQDVETP